MRKLIVIILCTSILLPGYASWYSGNIFNSSPGSDDIYIGEFSYDDLRILFQEASEDGWCCKDGRVIASKAEDCGNRGGKFFRSREEADNYCRKEKSENGWCCKDGRVIASKAEDCGNRGGKFFRSREEADNYCRKEKSEKGWCCKDGRVIASKAEDCGNRGGKFFRSREEADNYCRKEKSEDGWCCKDGRVIVSKAEECRKRGGTFFRTRREAEKHCRKEKSEDGWCCKDGRIIASNAKDCRKRGGKFFRSREEAEKHCRKEENKPPKEQPPKEKPPKEQQPKEPQLKTKSPPEEPKEIWCCKDGKIFPSYPSDCKAQGGKLFHTLKEAEEFCLQKDRKPEIKDQQFDSAKSGRKGSRFVRAISGTTLDKTRRKNPFTPIFVHLIRRHLAGNREPNALDLIFQDALKRVGGVNRELLKKIVRVYDEQDGKKGSSGFEPIAPNKPDLAPITIKDVDLSFKKAYPTYFEKDSVKKGDILPEEPAPAPVLIAIAPKKLHIGHSPGTLLTLIGNNFSPVAKENGVELFKKGAATRSYGIVPVTSTKNQMQFLLPYNFKSSSWQVRVVVGANKTPSNKLDFQVHLPPKPLPVPHINYITPMGEKPGGTIYIYGKNFDKKANIVVMRSINIEPEFSKIITNAKVANAQHRLEMVLPKYAPPCKYEFQVTTIFGSSNKVFYSMSGFKYKVVFKEMHCLDETNPEANESDEMVTFWVIMADEKVIHKSSRNYDGFNDGSKYSYQPPDDIVLDWTEIKNGLSIATELWEWDEGDIQSAKTIGVVSAGVGIGLGVMLGYLSYYGGIVGALVLAILFDNFDWIAKNIFGMDNDRMGQNVMTWTQEQLMKMVSPQSPVAFTINFKDHGGEYNIYVTIYAKK